MKNKTVHSVAELRELVKKGVNEFYISLAGGWIRSSKNIVLNHRGHFEVFNEVDGTVQVLTEKTLFTRSNIGEAITKGALLVY